MVYAPVAPTLECLRLLRELEEEHGDLGFVVVVYVFCLCKGVSNLGSFFWGR